MTHPFFTENQLTQTEAEAVTGGNLEHQKLIDVTETPAVRPVKPPYYVTLAIGEDGGKLPGLESA